MNFFIIKNLPIFVYYKLKTKNHGQTFWNRKRIQ